jgi:hypothetical protein
MQSRAHPARPFFANFASLRESSPSAFEEKNFFTQRRQERKEEEGISFSNPSFSFANFASLRENPVFCNSNKACHFWN